MERIEPTRALALKVWWAFLWRSVVFACLAGFAVGFLFALAAIVLKLPPDVISAVSGLFGVILGALLSIEAMYRILKASPFIDQAVILVPLAISCPNCKYEGQPADGRNRLLALLLFLIGIIPGLIYWLLTSVRKCPNCGFKHVKQVLFSS